MSKIDVQFLFNEKEQDLFAFFPNEIFDINGNKCSYSKIGQHSACSEEYANESRKANFHEYKDLYIELRSIGYNINVQF